MRLPRLARQGNPSRERYTSTRMRLFQGLGLCQRVDHFAVFV